MKQQQVTALSAGAQEDCVQTLPPAFQGMGSIAHQPYFRGVARRDLMAAVNTVARDLGLRPASVVVIDALLSCLPCKDSASGKDAPITPLTLLTVFAANDTLCFRAKGITDRQLRRHLARLEEVGLIQRRDSANGKRFPIYRGGKVVAAFGIDLTPLLLRADELMALAQRRRCEADELRGLKSCIQRLRAECLNRALSDEATAFVEATRNVLRRAGTTLTQARAILQQLKSLLTGAPDENDALETAVETKANADVIAHPNAAPQLSEPCKQSGTDGQNVRHKEPPNSYTKKTTQNPQTDRWEDLKTLSAFYPKAPTNQQELTRITFEFGQMLRIAQSTISKAISTLGYWGTLFVQEQLALKADAVRDPDRYFLKAIQTRSQREVGHGQLLPASC
ncbi:replication initiator RepC [Thioclava dalianensis]|uniref:Replication initiator RepC n=1 Tax=Thioclava dalianensis TaxID=1185766 RepID=A0A074TG07_9RHOB|nr:helix-turn-helix domain-containing protein [Thioclava dalianensis]KEP67988.1 replication initiator RepC [Thioclava dalianensis]SFN91218.1 replication initiation protein RepC [Thioclava dalianensis]